MTLKSLPYLAGLWLAAASCSGDTITLVCAPSDRKEEHIIRVDTAQNTVLQDDVPGIGVKIIDSHVLYYFKYKEAKSMNKLDLAEDYLYMATPKSPPDTGYNRAKLACRRN